MFLVRRSCPFLLLPWMGLILILASAFPAAVLADDDVPTPEATPVVADTPDAPGQGSTTNPFADSDVTNSEGAAASQSDGEVVVSHDNLGISAEGDTSPAGALAATLPIWCPTEVDPTLGESICTAESGSSGPLMDHSNSNGSVAEAENGIPASAASDEVDASSGQSHSTDQSADGDVKESAGGVNVIILDSGGNALPLDNEIAADALLNGQPVWCPDGLSPADEGESCTSSVGSLGLLVSMMENGSLEDGAIYIQAPQSPDVPAQEDASVLPQGADSGADAGPDPAGIESANDLLPATESLPPSNNSSEDQNIPPTAELHDPIWCPASAPSPTPGAGGCTAAQPNLESLISFLMTPGNEPGADGTIWIQQGIDTSSTTMNVIDGNVFTNWRNYSLSMQGGWVGGVSGDPSITGNTTFSQTISVTNWLNDVSVSDIIVQNTLFTGLHVFTTGNIDLNDITSTGNALDGVFVHNDTVGSTGTVTITGTNNISNNLDDGLIIRSNGDITTNQITATGNGDVGAYYRNDAGTGDISLTGTNIFNDNGGSVGGAYHNGLKLDSNGSISIHNITASDNFMSGTDLGTSSGSVTLTGNNSFVGNGGVGLDISITSGGSINLHNIAATNNTSFGAYLSIGSGPGTGNVDILGVNAFDDNSSDGLVVSTYGDINLNNFSASRNLGTSNGASIGTPGDITMNYGNFYSNGGYGLDDGLDLPTTPSSITLYGVTFYCNGLGDHLINSPTIISTATFSLPCVASTGNSGNMSIHAAPIPSETLSLNLVGGNSDTNTVSTSLNCTQFSGTVLLLPNGDRVTYLCPTTGEASLSRVENEESLPGALPSDAAFMSAMETHLTQAGIEQNLLSGDLIISFVIPVDMAGFNVGILYRDGSTWLDLSTAAFTDGRSVLDRGIKTEDGRFEAATNFPGTFVLVRK